MGEPRWWLLLLTMLFATLDFNQCERANDGSGMESISSADQRKISVFVRELYSLGSVNAILDRVVHNLHTLIAANSIFVPAFDPRTGIMSVLADDVGPELHKLWPRHENPAMSRPSPARNHFKLGLRHAQGLIDATTWKEFNGIAAVHGVWLDLRANGFVF